MALVFLWMFGHGIAAVKLIQHILCTFPSCASIGMCLSDLVLALLSLWFGSKGMSSVLAQFVAVLLISLMKASN